MPHAPTINFTHARKNSTCLTRICYLHPVGVDCARVGRPRTVGGSSNEWSGS